MKRNYADSDQSNPEHGHNSYCYGNRKDTAGLIAVMPLAGALVLVWMHIENKGDPEIMQDFTKGALWGILPSIRDLCITPPFARLLRQAQISILEILNVFLRLKLSPSLYLDKIGRSSKVSILFYIAAFICFKKHLPLPIVLVSSFGVWLAAAFIHQWILK